MSFPMPNFFSSNRNIIDLTNEMHQISVERLERIHPVWKKLILNIKKLPTPSKFNIQDEEENRKSPNSQHEKSTLTLREDQLEKEIYTSSHTHLLSGNFEKARQHAKLLLEHSPQEACYRLLLGLAEFGSKNYHKAIQQIDLALHYAPENPTINAVSGLISAFSRDHVKSMRCSRTALNQFSKISHWGGAPWLELALFQSEYLLFGNSSVETLDSRIFSHTPTHPHLEELSATLSPIHEYLDFSEDGRKDVIFVSCDNIYFYKYAVPLALSMIDCRSPLALHLHIINPDDEAFHLIQRLATLFFGKLRATYERTAVEATYFPPIYYSCIRFCRMAQFKTSSSNDYAMLDADMLINRSFTFSDVRSAASLDANCILTYSQHEPIWDCLLAGFCLFGQKTDSILINISAFVLHSIQQKKFRWFLDQIALFLATQHRQDQLIGYVTEENFYDLHHNQDSYIWAITTEKKSETFTKKAKSLVDQYLSK